MAKRRRCKTITVHVKGHRRKQRMCRKGKRWVFAKKGR